MYNETITDISYLSQSICNYFMLEIEQAEGRGLEISKFIISFSDFNIMTASDFRISYNLNRASKDEPIGTIFGCSLHLKDSGDMESYYVYPEGYLGVITKDEIV